MIDVRQFCALVLGDWLLYIYKEKSLNSSSYILRTNRGREAGFCFFMFSLIFMENWNIAFVVGRKLIIFILEWNICNK